VFFGANIDQAYARHVVRASFIAALLGGAGCAAKPPPRATLAGVPAPSAEEMAAAFVKGQSIRCSWGLAEACMSVGDAYAYGLEVSADAVASMEYYRRACSVGATDGCVRVGIEEVNRRLRHLPAVVADTFEPACEKGSYWGCYAAGIALARDPEGHGSPSDIPRGRAYLERACAARYLPACYEGAALVVQLGETSSYGAVNERLIQGCQLRETQSCHYLGLMALQGTFGARDELGAANYFVRGCRHGLGESCLALAYLYQTRLVRPPEGEPVKKLLWEACRIDYQPACDAMKHPERGLPPPEVPR